VFEIREHGDITKPSLSIHYAITAIVAVIVIGIAFLVVRWGAKKGGQLVGGVSPQAGQIISAIGMGPTGNPNIPSQS